jgi:hypothetical protein
MTFPVAPDVYLTPNKAGETSIDKFPDELRFAEILIAWFVPENHV